MSTIAILTALATDVGGCFTPKTFAALKAKVVSWVNEPDHK